MNIYQRPFHQIENSTNPAFSSTLGSSELYALQSTALNRFWATPNGRTVRVASLASDDYYLNFGSSLITVGTTNGVLVLGGTVELFGVVPGQDYVAVKSSTDVIVNFTLGLGQ